MKPRVTYLIDTENVQNVWTKLLDETKKTDDFVIFYTVNSSHLPLDILAKIVNEKRKVECVETDIGTNALDVTLITDLAIRAEMNRAKNPNIPREYVIVSDDKGYEPAIHYLNKRGIAARRLQLDVTTRHKRPQPANAEDERTEPESAKPKPRYTGVQEQWRQTLLRHPGITESDVTVCIKYLIGSMTQRTQQARMEVFRKSLDKYYKNDGLSKQMYERVKPAITYITTNGPHVGKNKK